MSKTFSKTIDKNSDVRFSLIFWFYRVFGCVSAMAVQEHYKKRFAKQLSRKVFTKIRQKNPKLIKKGDKTIKHIEKKLALVLLWPLTRPPIHHGGRRLVFAGPLI
jgi:hypothetical protein